MNDVKTKLTKLTKLTGEYIKELRFTDTAARITAGITAGIIGFLMFLVFSSAGETLLFIMALPVILCIGLIVGVLVFELFKYFKFIETDEIISPDELHDSKGADT